jgi:hypothetical protein
MYGPYMPLRPGRYRVRFDLAWEGGGTAPAAVADVAVGEAARVLARAEIRPGETACELAFEIPALEFAGQFRIASLGGPGFAVRRGVVLEEPAG